MVELFRYIEQAFVVPSRLDDAIDVTTDSGFQNELRGALASGESGDAIRARVEVFLSGVVTPSGADPLSRAPQYVELNRKLRVLASPTASSVKSETGAIFDEDPDDLVASDAFGEESILASDLIVAIKLMTAFDRIDAAAVATMRRVMTFLTDFVAGRTDPLTSASVRQSLSRPLKIPQVFLPRADPDTRPPEPPPPPPDPAVTRREELLKEQAALQDAYDTLMRVHPSQLEVRTFAAPAAARDTRRPPGPSPDAVGLESESAAALSMLVVPPRTLDALDRRVRRLIESELREESAAVANVVGVVKQRWLDVSSEVEPYKLPQPAKTYRVGLHLFAVREPQMLAEVSAAPLAAEAPDFSHAVTRPVGIGNLQVVRQELIGYEAADISHIENVMPGELMRRVTRREETTELILTDETQTTQSEERDLQSTERNELSSEAQKEASQQSVATQDQTTTTNYGRLVENSKTNYARSVTDRAVNTLTRMVKQQRIQREKKVYSDRAVHEFDNKEGSEGIRGIYQWIDKKYKTRIYNYGKRLLYDVVVPEPASFLIDSLKRAAQPENFQLTRPSEPYLYPSSLNASNYMYWATLYGVTGAVTPPPDEFVYTVAHVDSQDVARTIQAFGGSFFANFFAATKLRIPDNYRAIGGYVQRTNRSHATSQPAQDRQFEFYIGEHYFLCFGTGAIESLNSSFAMRGETGEIPVTVRTFTPTIQFNFAVGINCQRTDKALEQWQLKTHAAIVAGYQRQRTEYLDQLGRYQAAVRTQMAMTGSFAHDSSMERQELKKAFIHLLMSEHFAQLYFPTPNPQQLPPDPLYVKKWGAVVAFFERAFEWEHLMYVYYPYFWGRPARWGELILLQDTDPEFEAFLKAGAARVVVPARPGFEAALAHYHETGDVWMGEEIPDMFSELYTSIIAEIKARNATPGEEVCVAEWDVRLPTTLVMLKDDEVLPEWKPSEECTPPPDV